MSLLVTILATFSLSGYYNPILSYGEEKAVKDSVEAGANGFIMVDLPPEEAIKFREICRSNRSALYFNLRPSSIFIFPWPIDLSISFVPLIAPSTSLGRVKLLAPIADSFIYVVSKVSTFSLMKAFLLPFRKTLAHYYQYQMGTTGSKAEGTMNESLPELVSRIREYTSVPLAVGFGVYNRHHFQTVAAAGADAVVVGSRVVQVVQEAGKDIAKISKDVEQFCRDITLKGQLPKAAFTALVSPPLPVPPAEKSFAIPPEVSVDEQRVEPGTTVLPARFGQFGGQYVPEALVDCLIELEEAHKAALADPEFWKEFESYYGYMNRPSELYEATRLTEHGGGARIWMKREDL